MPNAADPEQLLKRLAALTAGRPTRPNAFIQVNTAAILAALKSGYTGIDLYQAFVDTGHPPPMSLRQFRRYLARLRPQVSATASPALTPGDDAARSRPPRTQTPRVSARHLELGPARG